MKKIIMMALASVMMFTSANAQNVVEKNDGNKFFDNTYVSVNGGVATKTTHYPFWKDMNANFGVRLGKDITPVFGVAIGSNAYLSEFGTQTNESSKWVKYLNTTALAKVNVLNVFGYNPDRKFNLSALAGPGWGHSFVSDKNDVTANFAINASYDITKCLSVYVEPSLIYGLQKPTNNDLQFNINRSIVQANLGLVWCFGKTKFTKSPYVALAEYEALNDDINALRAELAKKPKEAVREVKENVTDVVYVQNEGVILFEKASAELTNDAKTVLDNIAKTTKNVSVVRGYASPEGTDEFNLEISKNRAYAVAKYLNAKGVTTSTVEGVGVVGNASNRIVKVIVK